MRFSRLKQQYRPATQGVSVIEVVIGAVILSVSIAMTSKIWTSSIQEGNRKVSDRAKIESAMRSRIEAIRHCTLFLAISPTSKTSLPTDCSQFEFKDNANISYSPTTAQCNDMRTALITYLSTNANSSGGLNNLLADFNLQDYDASETSTAITINTNPGSLNSPSPSNTLKLSLSANNGLVLITKQTTLIPEALSWC